MTEPEWQASMTACSFTPCSTQGSRWWAAAAFGTGLGGRPCAPSGTSQRQLIASTAGTRKRPPLTHRGQRVDEHAVQVIVHNLTRLQQTSSQRIKKHEA